jgi:hypothetical protein
MSYLFLWRVMVQRKVNYLLQESVLPRTVIENVHISNIVTSQCYKICILFIEDVAMKYTYNL